MIKSANPLAPQNVGAYAQGVRRILVPLDGSSNAVAAVPYALALAQAAATRISLLAVVEPLHLHDGLPSQAGQEADERRIAVNAAYLDAVATGLRARGLTVETAVRHGDPASAIVAASAEKGGARRAGHARPDRARPPTRGERGATRAASRRPRRPGGAAGHRRIGG